MKNIKLFNGKKSIIIINLLLILALMTGSVYAWFAVNVENKVDVYEIEVQADNALELSFTGGDNTWSTSLNLANLKNEDDEYVLTNLKFGEITGDGTNFNIPALSQYGNYALVDTSASSQWDEAEVNTDYLQFKVLMRTKDPLNVFLSSDSAATPAADKYKGEDCERRAECLLAQDSEYFSKDCIVGALRVSFEDEDKQKNIWITNPNLHLTNSIGDDTYSMDFESASGKYTRGNGQLGGEYEWNDSHTHYYYDSSRTLQTSVADTIIRTVIPDTINKSPYETGAIKIASLTDESTKDSEGYYHDEIIFTIWLEGCDTEARRALVGGKFKLSLAFDSIAPLSENQ